MNGLERLSLASGAPLLLVAGTKDMCIPAEHTTRAHEATPGSRLELLSAGHFPHRDRPERFAALVLEFLATTRPAHADLEEIRRRLRTRDPAAADAA
jgi:pimeloyl-ACP methyl ester carboxylesterase